MTRSIDVRVSSRPNAQLRGPRLQLAEEPRVLDGDHACAQSSPPADLLLAEGANLLPIDENAPMTRPSFSIARQLPSKFHLAHSNHRKRISFDVSGSNA